LPAIGPPIKSCIDFANCALRVNYFQCYLVFDDLMQISHGLCLWRQRADEIQLRTFNIDHILCRVLNIERNEVQLDQPFRPI
jgi:hypothetical protein